MRFSTLFLLLSLFFFSCSEKIEDKKFTYLKASFTGINFNNSIVENDSINVVDFQYIYNGGGVGIGDFNNDGLSDIIFTGNQVSSKIYLNQGDFKFKDISKEANFKTSSWVTGVSIVDINADGYDDIYVSVGGSNCNKDCENLLFINKGVNTNNIPVFEEQAEAYGLNDSNYSQQAVFFDYDLDGDLDVLIAHNGNVKYDKNSPLPKHYVPKKLADYLLRNDTEKGKNHPVFTNVSDSLGIVFKGFSLGVGIQDFNNDNLPDIYISNDFITDDLMYLNLGLDENKQHKGFAEVGKKVLKHQTYNAMGVDIADVNNDAYPDVFVVDMLPENYKRQKTMLGSMNYDKFLIGKRNGYASQFMHNTLQIHNGVLNDSVLEMSEIGYLSGMAATDWSWAPLLADFDNDGDKDAYITNGYVKNITDLDFINYSTQSILFGTEKHKNEKLSKQISNIEGVCIPNYFYENTKNLKFKDVSQEWMPKENSFSNGAAYADLDNDGDLDIVVNNINQKAFVIQNNTENSHYLRIKLLGAKENKKAIGAKVTLWTQKGLQQQYQSVVRGYLSSQESVLHFGLKEVNIDSLEVVWPNRKVSKLYNVEVDSLLEIAILSAKEYLKPEHADSLLFKENTKWFSYQHVENQGHDYTSQHLLMKQYSKLGPCIAVGNIDGKHGDELFVGGSKGQAATIWKQSNSGAYQISQTLDAIYEDTDAVFVDVDNDGDLDLYVASGGSEFPRNSEFLQDRVYKNDGKGEFKLVENLLPKVLEISACVKPNDFDKDGDIDFFVGSSLVKGRYPETPKSQLLIQNSDVFELRKNKELENLGMITDAEWADVNKDGWDDLVVIGEWMPVTIFINHKGILKKTETNFKNDTGVSLIMSGWWNTLAAGDFDKDGDVDFIVGNQGENNFVAPKNKQPVYVYKQDYDGNGSLDPIVAQYFKDPTNNSTLLPVHTRDDVMKQLVKLKDRYETYKEFSDVGFEELLQIKNLEKETLKATTFSSSYLENLGDNTYNVTKLPELCQVAPINDILIKDINKDGFLDALLVGNDVHAETNYGHSDGVTGIYLQGTSKGFKEVSSKKSGFYVPKQSNHIAEVVTRDGVSLFIATQNQEKAKVFTIKKN